MNQHKEITSRLNSLVGITKPKGKNMKKSNFAPSTPEQIKGFINKYCVLVSDTDDDDTELYMDNHKCIIYGNKQYYLPEDINFGGRNAEIYDLLIDSYQYS